MSVTISCIYDGFEVKGAGQSVPWPGSWFDRTSSATSTSPPYPFQILVGNYFNQSFKAALELGPIAVSQGESINSFKLRFYPTNIFKNVDLRIRAIKNSTIRAGSNRLPTNQVLTSKGRYFSLSNLAGYSIDSEWLPDTSPFFVDVTTIAQEVINDSNWSSGNSITFIVDFDVDLTGNGRLQIKSEDNTSGIGSDALLVTTAENTGGTNSITSVGGDNKFKAGENNIQIVGVGFQGNKSIKLYNSAGDFETLQITSSTSTTVNFNYNGVFPVGTGYRLDLTIDQLVLSKTVEIESASGVSESLDSGTVSAQDDGFEWVIASGSFPGAWVSQSGVASNSSYFPNSQMVGKYGSIVSLGKAAFKIGPLPFANSEVLSSFVLEFNVLNAYRYVNLSIKAQADPNAADIGAANLPTNATLTTASTVENTSTWLGSSPTSFWIPSVNPKSVNVTAVAQEVVDHANWSVGDSIWFVVDYIDIGDSTQGTMAFYSTKSISNESVKGSYVKNTDTQILTVSSDNVLSIGEENVTITGINISGASALVISKGAISEAQTITSNTDSTIIFSVTTGAIVADTGYTLTLTISGVDYTKTIDFVNGGGIVSGEADTTSDGIESGLTVPPSGTFLNSSDDDSIIDFCPQCLFLGFWGDGITSKAYYSYVRVGPIYSIKGQTFSTCNLVFNPEYAYKGIQCTIKAVVDPTVGELSQSDLPSDQTLTTASATFDTTGFAGYNATDYWLPAVFSVDVTDIVEEVSSQYGWGQYVNFVINFAETGIQGYISLYAEEHATERPAYLDYTTESATSIANVNGNNVVRHQQTNVNIFGADMLGTTSIKIIQGSITEDQTIKTNTATDITFDFNRGRLGYGPAIIRLSRDSATVDFNITIESRTGYSWVTVGTPALGDNGFAFNANPALVAGDIIEWQSTSANGFPVLVDNTSVPSILGGELVNTFIVSSWRKTTGTWYDEQTATFSPLTYLNRNIAPVYYYEYQPFSDGSVITTRLTYTPQYGPEEWRSIDKSTDGERYT